MQLRKLRNPMICYLQAVEPEKSPVEFFFGGKRGVSTDF
jgi:hypothetical protein